MAELHSRDALAEPLRQLGHVMACVAGRVFLPDATGSGRWTNHPRLALRSLHPGASVADVRKAMTTGDASPAQARAIASARACADHLHDTPGPGRELSDIEECPSDVSEPDEADEGRDALEATAAGVLADSTHLKVTDDDAPPSAAASTTMYAPPG